MRFLLLLLLCASACAAPPSSPTSYWVDAQRSSNGDGSQSSPWKLWGNIDWSKLVASTATGQVSLVLSSRSAWADAGDITIAGSGIEANRIVIDGNAMFQTQASGTASWTSETTSAKATFASSGSGFVMNSRSNITLAGVQITNSAFGGVNLGTGNPTTNIKNITITNCNIISPVQNHGIWAGYMEAGCSNIVISGCYITNTSLEGIYLGHFSYLSPTITGCVVENNTLINTGLGGQGDIDIKPGVVGCIVRSNTVSRTVTTGSTCGAVIAAPNCEIYGNFFHDTDKDGTGDWGFGIYVNGEGDGAGNGVQVTGTYIHHNSISNNPAAGIRLLATVANSLVIAQVYQNTIQNNDTGIELRTANGRAVIAELCENIFSGNTGGNVVNIGGTGEVSTNSNCVGIVGQATGTVTMRGTIQWR